MGFVEELLGCPLQQITRSYWVVRLNTGEWMTEARLKIDVYNGTERFYDWSNDLVANGDVLRITQLWLLCPPSASSPLGNTARLDIIEPGTAFQFKLATADPTGRTVQAHIIGKVTNKETGACDCYIWDTAQDGLCTPETLIYDSRTGGALRDATGQVCYAGKSNVYHFHSWRSGIAPLGRLELETLGVRL